MLSRSSLAPTSVKLGHGGIPVSATASSRIIRFSTFEVNLHTGELRHRGQKVKLQEQPFQVLAALLERPGELVTREELRSKLWSADTFVDFDHSLSAAIKRLREALGESADTPIFRTARSEARRQHEKQRWFKRGQKWRTGCEGRISVLKRRHGLGRCRYRGIDGMRRWVGLGVIADNLINLGCRLTPLPA